jgi:hypothetical protein
MLTGLALVIACDPSHSGEGISTNDSAAASCRTECGDGTGPSPCAGCASCGNDALLGVAGVVSDYGSCRATESLADQCARAPGLCGECPCFAEFTSERCVTEPYYTASKEGHAEQCVAQAGGAVYRVAIASFDSGGHVWWFEEGGQMLAYTSSSSTGFPVCCGGIEAFGVVWGTVPDVVAGSCVELNGVL